VRISASSIKDFQQCPRKWAFRKLAKLPQEPKPYFERGTKVHLYLEKHKRDGYEIPLDLEGRMAITAIPHIPASPDPFITELELQFESYGVPWVTILDGFIPPDTSPTCHVVDYKTTGNIANVKTERELQQDNALNLYDHAAGQVFGAVAPINTWIYMLPKGPAKRIQFVKQTEDADAFVLLNLVPAAREMLELHNKHARPEGTPLPVINTLPHRPMSCNMGSKCDYRKHCKLFG
jgi:hypothetical protein